MPYTLTEEEKRLMREEYLNNIKMLNKYLPDNLKIKPNLKAFNKKINDPLEQRKYKRGLELKEIQAKKDKIASELFEKYKHLCKPDHEYLLDRNLSYIVDPRPGAEKYNEALIKTYVLHPEAIAQYYYKKGMELDPSDFFKITKNRDMENQLIEYYAKNRVPCEFAFTIKDGHKNYEEFNPIATKYIPVIKYNYELIGQSGLFVSRVENFYFTMPDLTEEQEMELEMVKLDPAIKDIPKNSSRIKVDAQIVSRNNQDIKKAFEGLEKGKYDVCKPSGLSNYVAKNKENGNYASFLENIVNDNEKGYEVIKLDEKTTDKINNFYERDYIAVENVKFPKPIKGDVGVEFLEEFRYRYAINNNKYLYELEEKSLAQLHSSVKKGFFEFIRRSTSQYTKDLQTVIKNFETPGNKDYKNKEKLKEAAEAYLKHRNVKTRADALRQSSAAKNRSLIALDIVAAVDALKKKEIVNEPKIIEKDDNNINLINETGKSKYLYVDAEEILEAENRLKERKPLPEFSIRIKESIDADDMKDDNEMNLSISSVNIRNENAEKEEIDDNNLRIDELK